MSGPNRYHHGDLRPTLLRESAALIREGGLEAFSLRKVAERASVTAASVYHHFRDKNDLLCALAEEGFAELERTFGDAVEGPREGLEDRFRAFVHAYVRFASTHPEQYDLMFGRAIWKVGTPTPELREVAYRTFRRYVTNIESLVDAVAPSERPSTLRLAQASWAMIHGLCRFRIDGIYAESEGLDAMSDEAACFVFARLGVDVRAPK